MMDVSALAQRGVVEAAGSAAAVSRALAEMSDIDLLRLRALARLRARGLPHGIDWSDLLHEALARALDGSRQWPQGVPFLVFLAGVMRSVCADVWRRRRREAELMAFGAGAEVDGADVACPAADQERVLAACEAVAAIHRDVRRGSGGVVDHFGVGERAVGGGDSGAAWIVAGRVPQRTAAHASGVAAGRAGAMIERGHMTKCAP